MFESSSEIGYFVRALRTLDDGLRAHISSVDEIVKPDQPEEVVETKPAVPEKPKGIPGGSKKSAKVKLTVRINFLKIGAIDTLKDRFNAEILVTAKWREPSLDGKKKELRYIKWDEQWAPRMTVSNTVGEAKMMASYNVFFDGKDRATACETKKVVGQFYESMELYDFPFDKQDLTVCATSERGLEEVELIEDDVEPSALNMRAFSAEQEWSLKEELKKWNKVTTKKVNNVKVKYPSFCVAARATRRPQFFIFNVFIVLIALCSMAFSSFTVSQELTPNRLQLTFTLILTCVTFKFVVSKSLPKISYLTLVDKYILGSMVILICMCYWHAISGGMIYQMFPKAGSVVATSTTTAIPTVSSFQTSVEDESSGDTALTTLQSDIGDQGSITSTAAPNKTIKCPTVAAAASTKPGPDAIKIDKVALGIFAGIYSSFNMYFLVKVIIGYCKGDEEGGEEEPDGGDDDEDGGD